MGCRAKERMAKSLKEKTFTIKFQMPYVVKVVITSDVHASFTKRVHETGEKLNLTETDALCSKINNTGLSIIFLPEKCAHEIAAHEAVHAIYNMYNWLGIEEDDSEVFAYQLEYLLRGIFKRL